MNLRLNYEEVKWFRNAVEVYGNEVDDEKTKAILHSLEEVLDKEVAHIDNMNIPKEMRCDTWVGISLSRAEETLGLDAIRSYIDNEMCVDIYVYDRLTKIEKQIKDEIWKRNRNKQNEKGE